MLDLVTKHFKPGDSWWISVLVLFPSGMFNGSKYSPFHWVWKLYRMLSTVRTISGVNTCTTATQYKILHVIRWKVFAAAKTFETTMDSIHLMRIMDAWVTPPGILPDKTFPDYLLHYREQLPLTIHIQEVQRHANVKMDPKVWFHVPLFPSKGNDDLRGGSSFLICSAFTYYTSKCWYGEFLLREILLFIIQLVSTTVNWFTQTFLSNVKF